MKKFFDGRLLSHVLAALLFVCTGQSSAEDIDIYRGQNGKNVMMVIDNSGSMTWPVYDEEVDYGALMKGMMDEHLVLDENDCRDGKLWWDTDRSGNDYDRLNPNGVYLVSTWAEYNAVQLVDSEKIEKWFSVISDPIENRGDETDPEANRRYPLLTNAIVPAVNGSGKQWTIEDPSTIDIDKDQHILFPDGITMDMDGREVETPSTVKGFRLPNFQDISLCNLITNPDTGETTDTGFLGILKSTGYYFSGLFEEIGADLVFTPDESKLAEAGFGGKRVYLFATGNWLNFIKLIEDFRVVESLDLYAKEGYYNHQHDKAWRCLCFSRPDYGKPFVCGSSDAGSEDKIKSRMEITAAAIKEMLGKTGKTINWGITVFNGNNGGKLIAPVGTDPQELLNRIEEIQFNDASPLGEAIQDAYNYNSVQFRKDPLYDECQVNTFFVVTAGYPSEDDEWDRIRDATALDYPDPEFGFCPEGYRSECLYYGDSEPWQDENHCDDVAHWLRNEATYRHTLHIIDFSLNNPLMMDMAEAGSGVYQAGCSARQLLSSFSNLGTIISSSASFSPPVIPVDPANRTQSGENLYMAFFRPEEKTAWAGNLKKYGLRYLTRGQGDCNRRHPEWVVTGKDGLPAVDCDGIFKPKSISFWAKEADGESVISGGAGECLMERFHLVDLSTGPFYDFRNIVTCKDPDGSKNIVPFYRDRDKNIEDTVLPSDLGIATGNQKADYLERDRIINYIYGYTLDVTDSMGIAYQEETDGDPKARRKWILGDIIHSEPCVIDYLDENHDLAYRFIAVGANDGMLHVFVDTSNPDKPDMTVRINGRDYQPGDEIWAFIPGELLPRLKEFAGYQQHHYFVDGFLSLHRSTTWKNAGSSSSVRRPGEYFDKTLVFGERRGGRCYWALDVSRPDPGQWSVKWRLKGGTDTMDYSPELGYSWSRPVFASIAADSAIQKNLVVFGGGYDDEEDHFPESWNDGDADGRYHPENPHDVFDVENPLHDAFDNDRYDVFNPEKNETGRGIFIVDLDDGSHVFKVVFGEDHTSGTRQAFSEMKWCFPADPSVINLSGNLLIYAADIYGQIWKATYDPYDKQDKWRVKRIFQANPGSDQPDAVTALSVEPSLSMADVGRKTFYSPDVSYMGSEWTDKPVLYFGTGDRVHPGIVPDYENRFYAISDTDAPATEKDLLNLTCDELDRNADVNQNGILEYDADMGREDEELQESLFEILYGTQDYPGVNKTCRGWYKVLGKQGKCSQDISVDHIGEMCLSRPVLFFKTVYFTTFQPVFSDSCTPEGNSFTYALDYSDGTASLDLKKKNSSTALADEGTLEDTYRILKKTGIPSGINVITRQGRATAIVSTGKGISGAGEEGFSETGHSSNIPAPPGGVQRLLWEAY
ncbi:MAG: PilC/PilY family type IV pilus protein [Desulfobacterales bacterium]